jgi:anti-anti-sigma factor
MRQDFSISRGVREGCQVVLVRGELDEVTAPMLDEAIDASHANWPVIVDLSAVEFITSAGLHAVLRERPLALSIVAPPGNVARLFEIVRANRRCPLFQSLDSAVEQASPVAASA